MFEFTLPDGRRCQLERVREDATDTPLPAVRVLVDGDPPSTIPLAADWERTAALPPGVADAIIRHFLLQ
jgi:hypothetical protein